MVRASLPPRPPPSPASRVSPANPLTSVELSAARRWRREAPAAVTAEKCQWVRSNLVRTLLPAGHHDLGSLSRGRGCRGDADHRRAAGLQRAEQQFLRERLLNRLVKDAGHGTRAEDRVVAALREQAARLGGQLEAHCLGLELDGELGDQLVDDLLHHLARQGAELQLGVEAIAELGAEEALVGPLGVRIAGAAGEAAVGVVISGMR